jgi:hypothetical protein
VVGQDVAGTDDHEMKTGPVVMRDVTDIEDMGWMQKEKRSFQAIPNWRNGAPNIWNESKEVPEYQRSNASPQQPWLIAAAAATTVPATTGVAGAGRR